MSLKSTPPLKQKHILLSTVAVSCGYSTCFAISACDGLCHPTKVMDRVGTPFGFQPIMSTFVRHTVSRCLIFPAPKVTWSDLDQSQPFLQKSIQLASSGSYLRVYMGCALAVVFRSAPSTFPHKRSTHRGPFPGVPSH